MQLIGILVAPNLFQTSLQDPEAAGSDSEWEPCLRFYDHFAINLQFDAKKSEMESLGKHTAFSKQSKKIYERKTPWIMFNTHYWTQGLKMTTNIMIKKNYYLLFAI